MRPALLLLFIIIWSAGCDSDEIITGKCYEGNVISYDCCSGISEISLVKNIPGAKRITINGTEYKNVIRVPGSIDDQHLYVTLKKYDSEKDAHLLDGLCLCIQDIDNPPNYTIVTQSTTGCP